MTRRYLRGNKSTAVPQNLVFLDCEAKQTLTGDRPDEWEQTLRLGVAISIRLEKGKVTRRKVKRFKKANVFWEWLETMLAPKKSVWLVAHNAPYDLKIVRFFKRVEEKHYEFDVGEAMNDTSDDQQNSNKPREGLMVLDDPPTIISLKHKSGGNLIVVDTLNYWRMSLKAIGEGVGIEKGEFPGFDGPDDELFDYCENDAVIIEKSMVALIQWWKENDYGMFRFTSPSLAMAAYRHRFKDGIEIEFHDETEVKNLERDSYTGGETEVYHYGTVDQSVVQLDVTSLYPAIMVDNFYPCRLIDWSGPNRPEAPPEKYPVKALVARVELDTKHTYPIKWKGSTLHVTGRFTTTLAGPELHRAVENGDVVTWEAWAFYRLAPIFRDYVLHFWELRKYYKKYGDKMQSTFVKLLLNSLYGKFGQLTPPWQLTREVAPLERWGKWTQKPSPPQKAVTFLSLDWNVYKPQLRKPSERSFHAVASFVTAYAREFMLRLRNIAGEGHFFYQATDSLCVSETGYKRLCDAGEVAENELGKLKTEHRSKSGLFLGNNWYTLDDKIIEGGKKKEGTTPGQTQWEELHFQHFRQLLQTVKKKGVIVKKIIKRRSTEFARGTVEPCGRVRPYVFPMEAP